MFRETRRKKQVLSEQECADILARCEWGVLGLHGDDGYPYTVPLNYVYHNGVIYFHSARTGHKIDAIDRDDKASFCVVDQSDLVPEKFATAYWSVIVFGRIEVIEDREKIYEISRLLSYKFTQDEAYIDREIQKSGPGTLLLALTPEHMTGKLVNEA